MGNKKCCTCSSSASVKVLLFIVPLIVVSGFVSVLGPLSSNWFFLSGHLWLWSSGGLPASSSSTSGTSTVSTSAKFPVSSVKERENRLDLAVVEVHDMEEAISDDSVFNRSSTPPHAIQPIQAQPVTTLFSFQLFFFNSPFSRFHSCMQFFSQVPSEKNIILKIIQF